MNKYEIMFILKSNDEEAIKNQVSELKAIITDMKGVIESEKEILSAETSPKRANLIELR